MALTDRAANTQLNAARVASNVDIVNPAALANQVDQRHMPVSIPVVVTSLTAGVTYQFSGWIADRAYTLISARVVPVAKLTADSNSFVVWQVVVNNDAGGANTVLASLTVNTTSLATFQSTAMVVGSTPAIAKNNQVAVIVGFAGAGQAINTGGAAVGNPPWVLDLVVQEV